MKRMLLNVNGVERSLVVDPEKNLADVLREQLAADRMQGLLQRRTMRNMHRHHRRQVETRMPCSRGQSWRKARRSPPSKALERPAICTRCRWHGWAHGGAQCGICTPGFIMSAKVLLDKNSSPTREEVRKWFDVNRNACRCTGYKQLVDAVMDAASVVRGRKEKEDLLFEPAETGASSAPSTAVRRHWQRSPAHGISAPTWRCTCRPTRCGWRWCRPRSRTPTSRASILPKRRRCRAWRRSSPWKDVKGKNAITGLITFPTNKGDGWDRPILCNDKVFQFGDAIAIVAADTEEHARAAAAKVKVDLEVLPAYMTRVGRHGSRRHRDSSRGAQHLLRAGRGERARRPRRSWSRRPSRRR